MARESLLALAALAGQILVDAAVGDEWETAQRGYAQLLGRSDAKQTRLAEQRLKETREQLMGATGTDVALIRAALAVRWAGRLADLLEENPDAQADLQALVQEIQAELPDKTPPAPSHVVSADIDLALAALAGQMVVDAAVGDEWETAQSGYAQLLGCGDAKQTRLAEQRLTETREQLMGATGTDMALMRTALAVRWAGRLADLLEENPDAQADLQALVQEIQAKLPDRTISAPSQPVSANGDATVAAAEAAADENPGALAKRSELAYSIGKSGDAVTARDQFAALLPVTERALGPEHPDTLAARANLAYWIGQAGDAATARDQFAALLPVTERVLGPEHPDTLTNRHNLANFTGYAGDAAAARDQFAALLSIRERVFGPDFPDTLVARFNLAYWTGRAGDAAAARDQFAALLPIRERLSGPDHPDTLAAREELAYWTGSAGDAAAARDQFAALLPIRERVLGLEHAETLAVWYQLAHWTARAGDAAAARE